MLRKGTSDVVQEIPEALLQSVVQNSLFAHV